MDADNFIILLVWGIFISIYAVTSIRKKKQAANAAPKKPAYQRPAYQRPAPAQHVRAAHTPIAAKPLPEEGQRVTAPKPKQPGSPTQPIKQQRSHHGNDERSLLHDKDALRRTLILGQILEPKF